MSFMSLAIRVWNGAVLTVVLDTAGRPGYWRRIAAPRNLLKLQRLRVSTWCSSRFRSVSGLLNGFRKGTSQLIVSKNRTLLGEEELLRSHAVIVDVLQEPVCIQLMEESMAAEPQL